MEIYGHRGAAGYVAENTIASMQKALELSVDGIEFDVRVSSDGVPVVIHDDTLDRTCDVQGIVKNLSAEELASQTARGGEPGVFVPTLLAVLKAIGSDSEVGINVELKEFDAVEPARAVLNTALHQQLVRPEQILITSFDHEAVSSYCNITKADSRSLAVGLLTKGLPDDSYWTLARQLNATSVNIDLGSVDSDFVRRAHAKDFRVMVYTVNTKEDADRMRELQVDAIFSDFPDRVRT